MTPVDEFIADLPEPQRSLVRHIRGLMFQASPHMREQIRYSIPFFDCPRWFCYLNPLKKGGIEVCFLRGFDLSNERGLLDARNRKSVKGITVSNMADLLANEEALLETIHEAIMLEENQSDLK